MVSKKSCLPTKASQVFEDLGTSESFKIVINTSLRGGNTRLFSLGRDQVMALKVHRETNEN
jgi:hypothetical protein